MQTAWKWFLSAITAVLGAFLVSAQESAGGLLQQIGAGADSLAVEATRQGGPEFWVVAAVLLAVTRGVGWLGSKLPVWKP